VLWSGTQGPQKGGFELDYIPRIAVWDFLELREQKSGRIPMLDVRETVGAYNQ
jgi:hypothetical protein